jgi:dTDP-glucose 4,6-dehydratase
MPRTLITGGAGFLGSHLCDALLKAGHEVIAMDNLITGSINNITHIKDDNFSFIKYDVTNYIYIDGPLDYILHFASPASPRDYLEYPIQTLKVGSLGTHKALGLALEKNATFLLASTSEVYGDPQIHPQPESYWGNVNPVGPRGVYDEAKRFSEALTMAYNRYHNVDTRIVRIFNTYGPRMRPEDGRAIPCFIPQALRGDSISVFGDGSQTRSFCFVSDLVDGIIRLLMSEIKEPVNIGNPDERTIQELAETILRISGSKSKIVYHPLPENDPKVRQPDISLAKKILNWKPKVDFIEGLTATIEWYRKALKE